MAETEKNKVHYDLQNVYVAPLTLDDSDAATFGTPERLYGAVGMDLSARAIQPRCARMVSTIMLILPTRAIRAI